MLFVFFFVCFFLLQVHLPACLLHRVEWLVQQELRVGVHPSAHTRGRRGRVALVLVAAVAVELLHAAPEGVFERV